MITDIRFACGRCGQDMVADSTAAGLSVNCPHCASLVTVPAHSQHETRVDRGRLEGAGEVDAEIIQLRDELAAACAECDRANAANTLAQAELKTFQAERLTLKNELAQIRQRLIATESQLSQQQELHTAAQLASQELGTEHDVLQLTLSALQARVEATQTQLSAKEADLENIEARFVDHDQRYSVAQHEITLLQEESALLRAHLGGAENARAGVERLQAQLKDAETGWHRATEELELARRASQTLQSRCDELAAESALLRADLSETQTGRELLRLRTNLQKLEEEHERVLIENRQLAEDAERAAGRYGAVEKALDATRHQLGEAEKRAEAVSDERLNHDNVALRGIISRQNTELEQRRVQLLRLKRMRLFVYLIYALLGLGFVILGIVLAALLPSLL